MQRVLSSWLSTSQLNEGSKGATLLAPHHFLYRLSLLACVASRARVLFRRRRFMLAAIETAGSRSTAPADPPATTRSFKPALLALGNRERGTDITRWKGCRVGLSSMIDTATALLALLSVSIFLAHALDAYNAK